MTPEMLGAVGSFLGALGIFIGVAFGLYQKFRADQDKRKSEEILTLEREITRLGKALALRDKRIARSENDVDKRDIIISRQRDYISLLKTILYKNNVEIPESRRRGETKTIDQMLDGLDNGHHEEEEVIDDHQDV